MGGQKETVVFFLNAYPIDARQNILYTRLKTDSDSRSLSLFGKCAKSDLFSDYCAWAFPL